MCITGRRCGPFPFVRNVYLLAYQPHPLQDPFRLSAAMVPCASTTGSQGELRAPAPVEHQAQNRPLRFAPVTRLRRST